MMFVDAVRLLLFPAMMAFAASTDLFTMTISNRVSLILAAGFVVLAVLQGMPLVDVGYHFAAGFLVLSVGFVFFSRGWIGGGDAKLAAATAVWLGFDHLGDYALIASLLGGLLTLAVLGLRRWPWPVQGWRVFDPAAGIPYGIALATAGLFVYPSTAIWLATASFH